MDKDQTLAMASMGVLLMLEVASSMHSHASTVRAWVHLVQTAWHIEPFLDSISGSWSSIMFKRRLRISRETFEYLCKMVAPQMKKQNTNMRDAITLDRRVALAVHRLASGANVEVLADMYGVARSTATSIILDFCRKWPSKLLLSANCMIWDYDVGWAGSIHDSQNFSRSMLGKRCQRGELGDYCLVGDCAYPARSYMRYFVSWLRIELLFPVEESATSMRAPPLLFLSLLLASLHSGSGHRRLATGDVLNRELPAECGDALCLVQAILNKRPQIFITNNIDLKGVGILPTIENRVSISGVCDQSKCKVDAGGAAGIFVVGLGGYLTLKDLDLTGGFCSRGSAVLVSGLGADSSPSSGKLEALNVKFDNNIATDVGGAVAIDSGGSAYVKNSVFYNNKASKGGAVFVGGSTTLPTSLELPNPNPTTSTIAPKPASCSFRSCTTFANTEFARNQADVAGGAVYVDDSTPDCVDVGGAQLDCTACTFVNNTAGQDGGALQLAFLSSGATANTKQSAFISNTAGEDGGDVNVQAGQVGAPGAQLRSYSTVYSASKAPNGMAVAVGPAASATFSKCDFSSYMMANSTTCEGTCNVTCPVDKRLPELQGSCADVLPPAPVCPWVPQECPPPAESTLPNPATSPPPPASLAPPQVPVLPTPPPSEEPPPVNVSPPPYISSPSPPSPTLNPTPPSSPSPPPPTLSPPPPEFSSPPPPSSPSPPPPQLSPPPPSPQISPPLIPPPSPPSNPPPAPPTTPPPPPKRRRSTKKSPSPPLYSNATSPPPPPSKKRWSWPPPPEGQGTIKNAPPAPPPPSTPSSPSPPPPFKKKWTSPPPQGTGTVENAPPAPPPPPSSSITGDPHFVGKHGERFDFHGKDGKDYCVVSDRDIHINMHVFHGKLRKSTFISKLGVLYRGQKILIDAQSSGLQSHFWKTAVDNVELNDVNSVYTRAGLTITRSSNFVRITVPGEVDILADIVRATFGKRGSLKDYINLQVKQLRVSPDVHGILGQTYLETAHVYEKLQAAKGKKRSRAAKVLVDGSESDYLTSDILSSDCKYSTFEAQASWPKRVKRTLFESMQTILPLGLNDHASVVRDCVGFGDEAICQV
ncbi:hypothetical protein GOP47_0016372 [Adiantum capillus-veneris]|uniref:Uncharacterized protein n=1 Tax=Adiantum capillus-veneris TaxID=13818 RepID=A0A9D4UHY9_ADICA|nr:hypothetical protein GOP47_0016372 [Adiantum capillus-veneris]